MNPLDWFQFIREFLHWDAERQAAFFTGGGAMLVAGLVVFFLLRRFFRRRSREQLLQKVLDLTRDKGEWQNRAIRLEGEIKSLKAEGKAKDKDLDRARQEKRQFQERIKQLITGKNKLHFAGRDLVEERNQLREQVDLLDQQCAELKEALTAGTASTQELTQRVEALQAQIQNVANLEGKIWERPVAGPVPEFRPLWTRQVPIVAVVNLKGGVGKTTITANLGATLWAEGKRVLLVDLDYQGSLTSLCLTDAQIADLKRADRLVHKLFRPEDQNGQAVYSCLTRIGESSGLILAATDFLADVEMDALARWLLEPNCPDIRFTLRQLLHAPQVADNFDVILLDCPPRLTTASINALTCCDYALIPVLPDPTSAEAVPRLLEWLKILKATPLCPHLSLLGVVANRAHFYREELVAREKNVWQRLPAQCKDVWGEQVYHFDTILGQDGQFAQSATNQTFAAFSNKLEPTFRDLAREFCRRIKAHESSRVAVLR